VKDKLIKNADFGQVMRDLRLEKEMSLDDLSFASTVAKSTISMIENSKSIPRINTVDALLLPMGFRLKIVELDD